MKKEKLVVMAEIAIFASIGFVLDLISNLLSSFFPSGGSIGVAMIVVVVISYRRGFIPGLITGLLIGLLDMTDGYYAISDNWWKVFLQIGLDYLFGYALVAICILVKPFLKRYNTLIIAVGTCLGGLGKYLSHFLSGVLFWPEFPNQPILERVIYSLAYNGSYMIPSIILTVLVMIIIYKKIPNLLLLND